MNKQMLKLVGLSSCVLLIVALLSLPVLAKEGHDGHKMRAGAKAAPAKVSLRSKHEKHVKRLTQAMNAIDKAAKEVEAGNKEKALVELAKAKKLIHATRKNILEMGKGKIVNATCPIMGSKLDPNKVPSKLTRMYKGKKIGFCCAGCPSAWDKLNDHQKQQKLSKAAAKKGQQDHSKH